ncbi:MAG: hypothetical protein AAFY42_11305 [Pseudomonadota bacterium]
MRVLVDLVDSFTGIVRFIILAMMVVGLGITLILTVGASYVAPKLAEDTTERAAQLQCLFGWRARDCGSATSQAGKRIGAGRLGLWLC